MFPLEQGAFEMLLIGAIALIVVGPKDLPMLMRKVGQFTAKMRGLAAEFRASFDEMARQSELDDLRREVEALRTGVASGLSHDPVSPASGFNPSPYGGETLPAPDLGSLPAPDLQGSVVSPGPTPLSGPDATSAGGLDDRGLEHPESPRGRTDSPPAVAALAEDGAAPAPAATRSPRVRRKPLPADVSSGAPAQARPIKRRAAASPPVEEREG